MGIQNFHTWLKLKYPSIITGIKANNIYDYIYIDVNYLLHNSMYGTKSLSDFKHRLFGQLNLIFSNFIATKKVYFNLDGPSSYAKIILQKKRRSMMSNDDPINSNHISSLSLTPGTQHMYQIEKFIESYIDSLKHRYKYTSPEFLFSKASECDEGEIKICKQIRQNANPLKHNHLIIGNDADLIVLSMALKPVYNINIFVKSQKQNELISLRRLLECNYTNIYKSTPDISIIANSDIRLDFVILSIMMGNDYFPKLAHVNHIKLWKTYYDYFRKRATVPTISDLQPIANTDLLIKDNTYNTAQMINFMNTIFNTIKHKPITSHTYNHDRSKSYLDGLLWCLNMYITGQCPKYDYMYDYASPHPYELLFHLCSVKCEIPQSNVQPIPIDIYPLIVMPKKAINLIPEKYRKYVNNELAYLYEIESCATCSNLHNNISRVAKTMYARRKANEGYDDMKKEYTIYVNEQRAHKQVHTFNFGIADIDKILAIVK